MWTWLKDLQRPSPLLKRSIQFPSRRSWHWWTCINPYGVLKGKHFGDLSSLFVLEYDEHVEHELRPLKATPCCIKGACFDWLKGLLVHKNPKLHCAHRESLGKGHPQLCKCLDLSMSEGPSRFNRVSSIWNASRHDNKNLHEECSKCSLWDERL